MTLVLWSGSNKQVQWVMVLTKCKFSAFPRSCKKKNSDVWDKIVAPDKNAPARLPSIRKLLAASVFACCCSFSLE